MARTLRSFPYRKEGKRVERVLKARDEKKDHNGNDCCFYHETGFESLEDLVNSLEFE